MSSDSFVSRTLLRQLMCSPMRLPSVLCVGRSLLDELKWRISTPRRRRRQQRASSSPHHHHRHSPSTLGAFLPVTGETYNFPASPSVYSYVSPSLGIASGLRR
ncbi:unnamed protein product [Schistocephalus solidus]|uniref:Uncharacterized protein n=1 Tax=Schistocephalus solidus TaxID=70667 RepID=A0A183THQ7_SCHSO|nr:unnamed protein product [Schistocephalus solidus]